MDLPVLLTDVHRSSMLPLGPWTVEVGISWVLASRFTSFNVIERGTVHVDGVVGFGSAFVAHHGSFNFGCIPLATEQKAITVDRFRNLRFICVYPVQLEGTLAKKTCLHCRLARWNKGVSSWSGCNMSSQFV